MKRHFIRMLTCLAFLLTVVSARADFSYATVDGVSYTLSGTYAYVTGLETADCEEIVIPSKVEYSGNSYTARICSGAFAGSKIKALTLPNTIEWVEEPVATTTTTGSGNGILASNSFTITGNSSTTVTYPTKDQVLEKIKELHLLYAEQFDECESLERILISDASTGDVSQSGAVVLPQTYSSDGSSRYLNTYDYFIYLPKGFSGELDLSQNLKHTLHFISEYLKNREYLTKITFPGTMGLSYSGLEGCPNIEAFDVTGKNAEFIASNGMLLNRSINWLEAFPPKHIEEFLCDLPISAHAFDFCSIDRLTITSTTYGNNSLNFLNGFKGNVKFPFYIQSSVNLGGLQYASPGYNLYLNPRQIEAASEYWPGTVLPNDLYIDSFESGYTYIKINFGGDDAILSRLNYIQLLDPSSTTSSNSYGKARKLDDAGKQWIVEGLSPSMTKAFSRLVVFFDAASDLSTSDGFKVNLPGAYIQTLSMNLQKLEFPGEWWKEIESKQTSATIGLAVSLSPEDKKQLTVNCSSVKYDIPDEDGGEFVFTNLSPGTTLYAFLSSKYYIYTNKYSPSSSTIPSSLIETGCREEIWTSNKSTNKTKTANYNCDIETTPFTILVKNLEILNADDSMPEVKDFYWSAGSYASQRYKMGSIGVSPQKTRGMVGSLTEYIYVSPSAGWYNSSFRYNEVGTATLESPFTVPVVSTSGIEVSLDKGDAKIKDITWSLKESSDKSYTEIEGFDNGVFGLRPLTTYDLRCVVKLDEEYYPGASYYGTITYDYQTKLPEAEIETYVPRAMNPKKIRVSAKTNLSDYETRAGFQWKKFDAPASLAPSEAYCTVYDGVMEGNLNNLSQTSYYNVRAFYRSEDGTTYYGSWVTFDPSDISYFEPTLHTYTPAEVKHNSAMLRGMLLEGSDEVSEQGFEYRLLENDEESPVNRRDSGYETVVADVYGGKMQYQLKDLLPASQYEVRSYAIASGKTYYGETFSFFTADLPEAGVELPVEDVQETREIVGRYNINGFAVSENYSGLVIILFSDGSSKKLVQK